MEGRTTVRLWQMIGLVLVGLVAGLTIGELRGIRSSRDSSSRSDSDKRTPHRTSALPNHTQKNYGNETVAILLKPASITAHSSHSNPQEATPYGNQTVVLRLISPASASPR